MYFEIIKFKEAKLNFLKTNVFLTQVPILLTVESVTLDFLNIIYIYTRYTLS